MRSATKDDATFDPESKGLLRTVVMATPSSKESRLFYRCAKQRYEEAQILLEAGRPTGAVYLAGYGIECMLKALVISMVPARSSAWRTTIFPGKSGT